MKTRIRVLRVLTAGLLVGWLAALGVVVGYRQWQRRTPVGEVPARPTPPETTDQPVRVQKGFVFTYALGVRPSIRLAASESVEFASGWLELSNVDFTFFQDKEVAYGLKAAKARFHQKTNEAQVEGQPLLSLGHGVVARAQGFSLETSEQLLRSRGPVSFAGVDWGGLAGALTSSLADDVVTVGDGVSLVVKAREGEQATMLAPKAHYRRRQGIVEFPETIMLFLQDLRMQATGGTLFLENPTGSPRKLALVGPVAMWGQTEDGGSVEGHWGNSEISRQEDGQWAFTGEASLEDGWAQIRLALPNGEVRHVQAWRFQGLAGKEGLVRLEGLGLACLSRSRPRELPSRLSGEKVVVVFRSGQAEEVQASGSVTVEEPVGKATGDSLVAKLPGGPVELSSERQVEFFSQDLRGVCQTITFYDQGDFVASGGVQGTVHREPGEELRFAARQAKGSVANTRRVTLVGDARIWQAHQLLRAAEIVLDEARGVVEARGKVFSQGAGQGTLTPTVEASELQYLRAQGEAQFRGGVRIEDQRGTVESQNLIAFVNEKGDILRGEFRGEVRIREKSTGRRILGDSALYDASTETLLVSGQPAVAEEPRGNRVQATHITWNRQTGSLEVTGDVDAPSQTLYHPEGPAKTPARRTPSPKP